MVLKKPPIIEEYSDNWLAKLKQSTITGFFSTIIEANTNSQKNYDKKLLLKRC